MIGIWQAVSMALGSVLATAAVAWFTFGNQTVTQAGMEAYVIREIKTERVLLDTATKSLDRLADKLDRFVTEQGQYRAQQAETNGELSALVDELRRAREART